jgi:hypothetical protein
VDLNLHPRRGLHVFVVKQLINSRDDFTVQVIINIFYYMLVLKVLTNPYKFLRIGTFPLYLISN